MAAKVRPIAAEVTVRRAGMADLSAMTALFMGYLEFYGAPGEPAEATAFLAERIAREQSIVLLARAGTDDVGFTQIYPTFSSVRRAPVWVLNDLYVRPESRLLGVGRALIRAVVALAEEAGVVRVTLSTDESNRSAQALYEAEGFTTGHPVRYYTRRVSS
ncbi:GNAT family N-acetyltransferase [Catellatospora sichuanensis]|uniref:GNAT family N-acetyltransferase n=1 Tax=Catellatospora sichuanensis TaxID=1969805 RepID=UPI00118306EC|nr:GNAT family N-acetyltransferase [Catellatospora sichuanensis]